MANDKELSALAMIDELRADDLATISRPGVPSMSMTIGALAAKLATMIPAATPASNGVMTAADRARYPAGILRYPFSKRLWIDANKKARIWIDVSGAWCYTRLMCWGDWGYSSLAGLIEKIGGGMLGAPFINHTSQALGLAPAGFYVSNTEMSDGKAYIDIIPKTGYNELCLVMLEVFSPLQWVGFSTELLDATDAERAMSNADEL